MAVRQSIADRFWSKVDRSGGPDACWPWMAFCNPDGYGMFGTSEGTELAHRVAWKLTHGPLPAEKPQALHSCDNPPCCNPAHLFAGTQTDNMSQAVISSIALRKKWRHVP